MHFIFKIVHVLNFIIIIISNDCQTGQILLFESWWNKLLLSATTKTTFHLLPSFMYVISSFSLFRTPLIFIIVAVLLCR